MIARYRVASFARQATASFARVFLRAVHAATELRMRRIQREIALQHDFRSFREATGLTAFNERDLQARS
jgi:hypothetical protein